MKPVCRHHFRGKSYAIIFGVKYLGENTYGSCDPPDAKNKSLQFTKSLEQNPRWQLEVVLHEAIHASFWDLSEQSVVKSANNIAGSLWKTGCRIQEPTKKNQSSVQKIIRSALRSYFPAIDPEIIESASEDISRFIYRLGYRV